MTFSMVSFTILIISSHFTYVQILTLSRKTIPFYVWNTRLTWIEAINQLQRSRTDICWLHICSCLWCPRLGRKQCFRLVPLYHVAITVLSIYALDLHNSNVMSYGRQRPSNKPPSVRAPRSAIYIFGTARVCKHHQYDGDIDKT